MRDTTVHTTTEGRVIIGDDLHKFARKWAKRWLRKHQSTDFEDDWDTHGCFDINLYVEDETMTITAYVLIYNDNQDVVADTSDYINLLQLNLKGKNK
jgi:hypothetical protein